MTTPGRVRRDIGGAPALLLLGGTDGARLQTDLFFFFFQAEDGIRDDLVTGVQMCSSDLCVSSDERRSRSTVVPSGVNSAANSSRSACGRSVICSNEVARPATIQRRSCRARSGF